MRVLILILCLFSFLFSTEFFEKASVVSNSLGGVAYRDVASVVLNPAVVNFSERSCFYAQYTHLSENIRFASLVYSDKFFGINTTLLFSQLYQDKIYIRQSILDEDISTYMNKIFGLVSFSGNILGVGVGCSIKTLYYDIYNTKSNLPLGLDLGVAKELVEVGSVLKNKVSIFGSVSINNLFGPYLKIGSETEKYATKLRTSLSMSLSLFPRYNIKKELLLYDSLGVFIDYYDGLKYGLEYKRDSFFVRCGYNPETFKKFSFGLGANFGSILLDYSFLPFIELGIHSLSFSYLFGEPKYVEKTPDELEDYLNVQKKLYRIADKYIRDAEILIREKKYDSAEQLLEKVYPVSDEITKIKELINISKNAKIAELTNKYSQEYTKYIAEKNYILAYDVVLDALKNIPQNQLTKQILEDFNKQNVSLTLMASISSNKTAFIEETKRNIKLLTEQGDFSQAEVELAKLEALSYDDYLEQKNYIESTKNEYVNNLIKKAVNFYQQKNYKYAYFYLYEAQRVKKNDKSISMQIEQIKNKFKKPALYEELYLKKLFYLTCIHLAVDEPQQAKQTFFELRSKYPVFEYSMLLESLIKQKILSIKEILP